MTSNKIELLNSLASRVRRHSETAVSRFKNQEESILLKPAVNGGWSVVQCLDHLNSYGHYYLPRLRTVLESAPASDKINFKSGWLGNYFANMMEPSSNKYKALKGHIPVQNLVPSIVIAEFVRQQEELLTLLQMAESQSLDIRIPISISRFIRLKAGDVFRFLIAHNERHIQQALRNL